MSQRRLLSTPGFLLLVLLGAPLAAEETFAPFRTTDEVPQNVTDLWKDYDPRREPLDVHVVREWKADGVVTRYVRFRVGTFKGAEAQLAAYYCFPENGVKNPAFVWSHGGGQRADRTRGAYFAKQGFATIDINWLGRPLEPGIDLNTDWGNVDPTQGPRFYAGALRKNWKLDLRPDAFSLDPVPSPRNSNWFLLAVAARRAITFLEQQPEVDGQRIGFAGYSMGGTITALSAIDPRLRAVAPLVGGTGFKHVDFPGIPGSSVRRQIADLELYEATIDASAYWPWVQCPVMFISSSNDFHAAFERIYQAMDRLPHKEWRVSTNMHQNHGPGPEQWVLLNQWFNQYLKGINQHIPVTPPTRFEVEGQQVRLTVSPAEPERLVDTEIYYSYDPNSITRFWTKAKALKTGANWSVSLPLHEGLPIYAFARCRYRMENEVPLQQGQTSTFVLNSTEHSQVPDSINLARLAGLPKSVAVFEDFHDGMQDWSTRDQQTFKTYKFQNPEIDRSNDKKLLLRIDPQGKRLALRLNAGSRFLSGQRDRGEFSLVRRIEGEVPQEIIVRREDFEGDPGMTLEWASIVTLEMTLVDLDTRQKLRLAEPGAPSVLQLIQLVD